MKLQRIRLKDLYANTGQIPGVPRNPRTIKDGKFEKLKKSLQEHPSMLELRELVAVDMVDKGYVVLGGNMRLSALKELGEDTAPVKVLPTDTPAEELRHFVINDNSGYGDWDADALGADWNTGELENWGMDGWAEENLPEGGELDAKEKKVNLNPYNKIHVLISFPPDKFAELQDYLETLKNTAGVEYEQSAN